MFQSKIFMVCRHVQHVFFCAAGLLTSENRASAPTGTKDRRKWISVFGHQPRHFFFSFRLPRVHCLLSLFVNIDVNTAHNAFGQRTLRRASLRASFGNTRKLSEAETFEKDIRTWQEIPFSFLSPSKRLSFLAAFIY